MNTAVKPKGKETMTEHTTIYLVDLDGKHFVLQVVADETHGPVIMARQTIAPGLRLVPDTPTDRDQLVAFFNSIDYEVADWHVTIRVPIGARENLTVTAVKHGTKAQTQAWAEAEGRRQARAARIPFVKVTTETRKSE